MITKSDCYALKNELPLNYHELCDLMIRYLELKDYITYFLDKDRFDNAILNKAEEVINLIIVEHLSLIKSYSDPKEMKEGQEEIKRLIGGSLTDKSVGDLTRLHGSISSIKDTNELKQFILMLTQRHSNFIIRIYQLLKNTNNSLLRQFDSKYATNAKQVLGIYPSYEKEIFSKEKKELIDVGKGDAIPLTETEVKQLEFNK